MICRPNNSRARSAGFTLVELLAGLAVSATVLSAAAALAFAVSHAWAKSEDINDVVSHGRNGLMLMSSRIRLARAIGYTDATYLLLWRDDVNGDGQVNQAELTLFRLDSACHRLMEGQYVFGPGDTQAVRDANNGPVSRQQFVSLATVQQMMQNPYYRQGPVAEYVQSVTWSLDAPGPDTRTVQLRLVVSKSGLSQALYSGMTLRSPLEVK